MLLVLWVVLAVGIGGEGELLPVNTGCGTSRWHRFCTRFQDRLGGLVQPVVKTVVTVGALYWGYHLYQKTQDVQPSYDLSFDLSLAIGNGYLSSLWSTMNNHNLLPMGALCLLPKNLMLATSLWGLFPPVQPTPTWVKITPTNPGPSARARHASVITDTKLYIFGGYDGTNFFNDFWVYDITLNKWALLNLAGQTPEPRYAHSLHTINNKIYLFGGVDFNKMDYFNQVYVYNIDQSQWEKLSIAGSLPTPRDRHAAATINNTLYILGGCISAGCNPIRDFWKLDVFNKSWQKLSDFNFPIVGVSLVFINSNLYLWGRCDYQAACIDDLWIYNVSANQWFNLQPGGIIPQGRGDYAAFMFNSYPKFFWFGGRDVKNSIPQSSFNDIWSYDVQLNVYEQILPAGPKPATKHDHSASVFNNQVYFFGGIDTNSVFSNELWLLTNLVPPPRSESPPFLNKPMGWQYAKVKRAFNYFISKDTFIDANNDTLTFNTSVLPTWLTFNPETVTFAGTPQSSHQGNYTITVFASDGISGQAADTLYIRVDNEPRVNYPIPRQYARINKSYEFRPDALTFIHPDKRPMNYTATVPSWLSFLADPVVKFFGTPTVIDLYYLQLKAFDAINGSATVDFALQVQENTAPEVIGIPTLPTAQIFKNYEYFADMSKFFNDITNDNLTYELTQSDGKPLPSWLRFKPTNISNGYQLSGYPNRNALNFYSDKILILKLKAVDDLGASATTQTFNLNVTGESWAKLLFKIGGPIGSGLGTLYAIYRNQAVLINFFNKLRGKYQRDMVVLNADNSEVVFEVPAEKIYTVQAFIPVEPKPQWYKFWKDEVLPFPGGVLPNYLVYDDEKNSIAIKGKKIEYKNYVTHLLIRLKNKHSIILEEFPVLIELPEQDELEEVEDTAVEEDFHTFSDISEDQMDDYDLTHSSTQTSDMLEEDDDNEYDDVTD